MTHRIADTERDGHAAVQLSSDHLSVEVVPDAGMIGTSLRHRGDELLGQRRGLSAWIAHGKTMGIPLLHPWANRLGRQGFTFEGVEVAVKPSAPRVNVDENGLPMHGLLYGLPWKVTGREASETEARLVASLDVGALPSVMASFPYPHTIEVSHTLAGDTLTVATTLRATAQRAVPVAFGYHPYLTLPGVPRASWRVELPVRTRAALDPRCLPTGDEVSVPAGALDGPLGTRTFDDLFPSLADDATFALEGGGRRVEVTFGANYPVAVIYAPDNDDVVCFEPMTATTAPFSGLRAVASVAPGESRTATFTIRVCDV